MSRSHTSPRAGFSIPEVMTAMFILVIGLVTFLAMFGNAVSTMQYSQEDLICKQKAKETMENIYTARENTQITFANIQNDTVTGGVFKSGLQPLTVAGPDGLVGTADDGAVETMTFPGPDGILGTADDMIVPLNNFKRQILITPLLQSNSVANPSIRQLSVTIQYTNARGEIRSYELDSLISFYR
jgi:hypothetical protein